MARQRDPRQDEAFELFKKRNGKITNREIATQLDVPEKTIATWKSRNKWNEVLQSTHCSTSKKTGAPKGNKNAVGNKGNAFASAKPGNKNALKTGEYETIFSSVLSEDELTIYEQVNEDPIFVLNEEVRLLKVRQYRMMKRINEAEAGLNQEEIERLQQLRKVKEPVNRNGKVIEIKREMLKDVQVTRKTFRKLDDIMTIEDALTRVSNQLQKAVKQLNSIMKQVEDDNPSNNEVVDWKQAVINAANKRAVDDHE